MPSLWRGFVVTDNPYWDAVKDHVYTSVRPWGSESEVGSYMCHPDDIANEPHRHQLVKQYSWTIPDPASLEFVLKYCDRPVLDPLAGTGYWAWLLQQNGIEVIASDLHPGDNQWHNGAPLHASMFSEDAVDAVKMWGAKRTLLLSWPPYGHRIGADVVEKYIHWGGNRIIYIGELEGGCCGTDTMFEFLSSWDEVATHRPIQWFGLHDYITVYERKAIAS
jgi:hypothetical protein